MNNRKTPSITKRLITILTFCLFISSCVDDTDIKPNSSNINKTGLINLVNNYRKAGCKCGSDYYPPVQPVTWNDNLERAAKEHSDDMNAKNYFDHTGSDHSSAGDRISKYNYTWTTYGENIAKGFTTEEGVIKGWIESTGHCRNIMNGNFKEMGVSRSGSYWTQVFAAR